MQCCPCSLAKRRWGGRRGNTWRRSRATPATPSRSVCCGCPVVAGRDPCGCKTPGRAVVLAIYQHGRKGDAGPIMSEVREYPACICTSLQARWDGSSVGLAAKIPSALISASQHACPFAGLASVEWAAVLRIVEKVDIAHRRCTVRCHGLRSDKYPSSIRFLVCAEQASEHTALRCTGMRMEHCHVQNLKSITSLFTHCFFW